MPLGSRLDLSLGRVKSPDTLRLQVSVAEVKDSVPDRGDYIPMAIECKEKNAFLYLLCTRFKELLVVKTSVQVVPSRCHVTQWNTYCT